MADLGERLIYEMLLGAEQDAKANSPFAPISGAADLVGKTLIQASPNFSIGENILAGLLTGAVGGGADYFTQNYANDQVGLLQSVFAKPMDAAVEQPEGLNDSIWNKAEAARSIFARDEEHTQREDERRAKLQVDSAVEQAQRLIPVRREAMAAELDEQRKAYGGMGGVAMLPPGLQDNAIAQAATMEENAKVGNFIDAQFQKAKQIDSLKALVPSSTAANEMSGIAISLTTALQKALGREMNAKEQERLQGAIPDWNDTENQLELKRQRFKSLMETISKSTPLLAGAVADPTNNVIDVGGGGQPGTPAQQMPDPLGIR